jgi:hypothetical protein
MFSASTRASLIATARYEQFHRPQCQTVTANFTGLGRGSGKVRAFPWRAECFRAIGLGAAWLAAAGRYHFPRARTAPTVPLQGSFPQASRQSRVEFRPLTFREDMVTCRHGGLPCSWGWCDQCDSRSRDETHSDRRFGCTPGHRDGSAGPRSCGFALRAGGCRLSGRRRRRRGWPSRDRVAAAGVDAAGQPPGGPAGLDAGVRAGESGLLWSSFLLDSSWWRPAAVSRTSPAGRAD